MIALKIDSQLQIMERKLSRIEQRQWPFVLSQTVNDLAFRLLDKTKRDIPKFIDRPTPFVINSFKIAQKATKQNPIARLEWRDFPSKDIGAGRPMFYQAYGGKRKQKAFERALQQFKFMPQGWFAIPSKGVALDPYGNLPGRLYTQILSYIRADRSGTQMRPRLEGAGYKSKGKAVRKQSKRASKYFVVNNGQVVGTGTKTKLQPGIYERKKSAFGQVFRQVFFFSPKAEYRVSYPVDQLNRTFIDQNVVSTLERNVQKAINTTR